ncbi:hypothetical protein LJR219_000729 [Phenylobacterium sp. LjRoot219]|uniref:hypothetical protein n=1 Tax=Phenylobacterium sp. LjRoot219 TaxID=3342283 RepID=UPI003ECFD0C3
MYPIHGLMVEETTAAAAQLRQQATALAAAVARFELGSGRPAAASYEAAPPARPAAEAAPRRVANGGWSEF